MIFLTDEMKIEITIDHYIPEQIRTYKQEGIPADFEFSGILIDNNGKEICKCPDEIIQFYKKEIIENIKEVE